MSFNNPNWLGPMLFTGSLPWENLQKSSLSQFLGNYSLHDSYILTLHIAPGHYAVAAIHWYTGLETPLFDPPLKAEDRSYAYLLIYFPYFYEVHTEDDATTFPACIGEAKSITLTDAQRQVMLELGLQHPIISDKAYEFLLEPSVCISTFISIENVPMYLTHGLGVYFVCLDNQQQAHVIPELTEK